MGKKSGGLMPANSPAGKLAAHLPMGKMGMTDAKAAKMKKKKGY